MTIQVVPLDAETPALVVHFVSEVFLQHTTQMFQVRDFVVHRTLQSKSMKILTNLPASAAKLGSVAMRVGLTEIVVACTILVSNARGVGFALC
jgi:hypothetical protein